MNFVFQWSCLFYQRYYQVPTDNRDTHHSLRLKTCSPREFKFYQTSDPVTYLDIGKTNKKFTYFKFEWLSD